MECQTINGLKIFEVLVAVANFGVIAFLTHRMTKANETLTRLQSEASLSEKPKLLMWVRDISDFNKELSLINVGKNDLLISYLTIQINGQTCDSLVQTRESTATVIDDRTLTNLSLKQGKIYTFEFGSKVSGGCIAGNVQLNNMKGDSTLIYFNMSKRGPYTTEDQDFFALK